VFTALLLLVACGGTEPTASAPTQPPLLSVATKPAAEPTAADSPAKEAPTTNSMAALDVGCPSKLVGYYKELLARDCRLDDVENAPPIAAKVLRNVAYAGRGHTFKSKALAAFYSEDRQGCDAPWYKPTGAKVTLEGDELACMGKLKKLEGKLRKRTAYPTSMDTIMLEQMGAAVMTEVERQLGHDTDLTVSIRRTDDQGWTVAYNYESVYEDETFESAAIVTCNRSGDECETFFAG
jgi:hypothetical protein